MYGESRTRSRLTVAMPRLLLASWGVGALADFVGRPPSDVRVAFVPTASVPCADTGFIDVDRDRLRALGYPVSDLDLVEFGPEQLPDALRDVDLLYVAGGNTFFLLHHMRRSGLEALLPDLFAAGLLYVGVSAGSCVVGPDCEPVSEIDSLADAPDLESTAGLNLVDFVVLPHFGEEDYTGVIERYGGRYELVPLKDDQAVRVEADGSRALVAST
jgi:dipeptidase E